MRKGIGSDFMEKTACGRFPTPDQGKGLPQPPFEREPHGEEGKPIDLPAPKTLHLGRLPLIEAIEARRSLRQYSDVPLTLEELSYLLWCTQGVKRVVPGQATFRTVPSAGARHPFETYLLVNRVEGLPAGLYRFLALSHRLALLSTEAGIAEGLVAACLGQEFVKESAVTFIWVAVPYRTAWRYGERAYRYLHLDAGHVCQNLYLAAVGIQAGACAIGAFSDEGVNALLGLDGKEEFAIYLATVGKPADA